MALKIEKVVPSMPRTMREHVKFVERRIILAMRTRTFDLCGELYCQYVSLEQKVGRFVGRTRSRFCSLSVCFSRSLNSPSSLNVGLSGLSPPVLGPNVAVLGVFIALLRGVTGLYGISTPNESCLPPGALRYPNPTSAG